MLEQDVPPSATTAEDDDFDPRHALPPPAFGDGGGFDLYRAMAEAWIRENPLPALAGGFVLGLLAGVALRR